MNKNIVIVFIYFSFLIHIGFVSAQSILEIPKGTVFQLRYELDIPANQNFFILGKDLLSESLNDIQQVYNDQKGAYSNYNGVYIYNDYLHHWQATADQSYRDCLSRHKVYYSGGGSSGSTNTIVTEGNGNTNIIINQQSYTKPYYGSYIGDNTCVPTQHSVAMLVLDKNKISAGGIFREGYGFKVRSVTQRVRGRFHIVKINFNHKVAKSILIMTTRSPKTIYMSQLEYRDSGSGFWGGLGSALASLNNIGGNHFEIHLPEKKYFE